MSISSKEIVGKQIQTISQDENLAIIEKISDISKIPSSVRMESYVLAFMRKGHASFFVDGQANEMGANQLFVFKPYITLERTMLSADAEHYTLVLSPQYTKSLVAMGGRNGWDIMMYLADNPIIDLTEKQAELFLQYHQLIRTKLTNRQGQHHREVLDSLFGAMLFEFHDLIEHHARISQRQFSSTETIFRDFYEILNNTKPKYKKVEYYAERLSITPKYFSAICKKLTGKTAMQHITAAVLKDITTLLKDERLSIKEIAQQTGFPNQSFLGSYVRKHLGLSPQKYRSQMLNSQ